MSAYEWKDTVGPQELRRPRLEPAWEALETNEFGLNEFVKWCRIADIEPFVVFNLGTRGVESACELVEYCNSDTRSRWADLRRQHGYPDPQRIRLSGLGNEMDSDLQIGILRRGSLSGRWRRRWPTPSAE